MKPVGRFVFLALFLAYFQGQGRYLWADGSEITLMNIDKVWAQNITGRNVTVAVVDDGVNYNHIDLKPNYKRTVSYDFVGNDTSPMPDGQMAHGTKCAGIIASRFRGNCRTGVAYNAKLAGIRVFNGASPNENRTAAGFRYKRNEIDIYSNSWGPSDNGYFIKSPGLRERQALEQGVNYGRGGLGSIFVFSSGNGGLFGDSCAFDGYVNNINTIAIGAFSKEGVPRYAEFCSAVMAAAYGDYVKTCSGMSSRCVDDFGRTSAAAAFASGIIALLLEANNKLTQRDVQHLIVRTSNPRKANINRGEWSVNGAGLMVHPAVGFGVMDAKKLVDVARNNWNTVPQRRNCSIKLSNLPKRILRGGTNFTFSSEEANECLKIEAIEHVQVEVSLNFSPRAIMEMYIISPHGTKSQLLYMRMFDTLTSRKDYKGLVVASLHFWGENPAGEWTVLFKAAESMSSHGRSYGTLQKFGVTLYGTEQDPLSYSNILPKGTITCGNKNKFWKGYGSECCGSLWTYDPDHEICCRGTYEIVKKNSQCGSTIYNECQKICCNGVLRNKFQSNASMSCCGRKSYGKKKRICCSEKVYQRYTCKWVWWQFGSFIHETKCSNDGSVRSVFVQKRCKNLKIKKQLCRDKVKHCYDWYDCTSTTSLRHKTEKCAKTCGFC